MDDFVRAQSTLLPHFYQVADMNLLTCKDLSWAQLKMALREGLSRDTNFRMQPCS